MDIKATLERGGLELRGDPPRVTVAVGDARAEVEVLAQPAGSVLVRASVPGGRAVADDELRSLGVSAPGDQRFRADGRHVVAERTLVEPSAGELFDRVHELAKSSYGLARVLAERAGLEQHLDGDEAPPLPPLAPVGDSPAAPAAPEPPAAPEAPAAPARWFYVDEPTPLVDSERNVVTVLEPGQWHRLVAEQGAWVQATAPSGADGWVERSRIRLD